MSPRKPFLAILLASASTVAMGNYVGTLKPPASALLAPGYATTAFVSPTIFGRASALGEDGSRFRIGYRSNPYFSIETDFRDYGRESNPFANPANLSSAFRSTGFGVDAVATLPFWTKFSLYGRFGAYRGDARPVFAPPITMLTPDATRATRVRYGLGMAYDITRSIGIRAEYDRFSPLAHPLPTDADSDQISVGVQWRF